MEGNSNIIDFKAQRRKYRIKRVLKVFKSRLKNFFCCNYDAVKQSKKKSLHKGDTRDRRF